MSRTRSAASTEKPMRRAIAAGTDLPSHAWTNSSADLSVHSTATGTHTLLLYLHILTQPAERRHAATDCSSAGAPDVGVPDQAHRCQHHHALHSIGRTAVTQRWVRVNQVSITIPPAHRHNMSEGRFRLASTEMRVLCAYVCVLQCTYVMRLVKHKIRRASGAPAEHMVQSSQYAARPPGVDDAGLADTCNWYDHSTEHPNRSWHASAEERNPTTAT